MTTKMTWSRAELRKDPEFKERDDRLDLYVYLGWMTEVQLEVIRGMYVLAFAGRDHLLKAHG